MPQPFDAISIGGAARQALADGAEGRVLAVFRRSFYVEMEDGRLACIGGPGLGDGPLNLRARIPDGLDFESLGMAVREPVHISADRLTVASLASIAMADAALWRPLPFDIPPNDDLLLGIGELVRLAGGYETDMGLASTLTAREPANESQRQLLDHAAPCTDALNAWLEIALISPETPPPPPAEAAGLIGLGPGLTPSGDDWLGGAMIALHAFERKDLARLLSQWALPLAQQRTGKISVAHLAAAAAGEGSAALHNAIAAIAAADTDAMAEALAGVDAIGHSSGWDAMAGAAAVMSLIAEN